MSEAYQQKEWELNSLMDNLNPIQYTYEEYKKEVELFIDRLLEDTNEINTLRNENKRLHSIIKEVREEIEYFVLQAKHLDDNIYLDEKLTNKLLEILDKENKDGER